MLAEFKRFWEDLEVKNSWKKEKLRVNFYFYGISEVESIERTYKRKELVMK